MQLSAESLFRDLTTSEPVSLIDLPAYHGIYALHDHRGDIRYVGITALDKKGFYGRIHNRHVSGSESRSYKFAHAYNCGRMWRAKQDTSSDAALARSLRSAFVRRCCRASFVVVKPDLLYQLPALGMFH